MLLGVHTTVGSATGGVGAFFNIPTLSINITHLDNVDQNCDPAPPSSSQKAGDVLAVVDKFFGNFTNVVPSLELNVGALAEFEVGIGDLDESIATDYTITATTFSVPTTCLSFDEKGKSFGPPVAPSPTSASAAPSVTGKVASKKAGAGRVSVDREATLLWGVLAIGFIVGM
jgi:hypothetical protein